MKTWSPRSAVLALAATMALAACATQPRYATNEFAQGRGVVVEVTNHNWADVVVYAASHGNRVRLGSVITGALERFKLPASLNIQSSDFHLEAHPVGSPEVHSSEPILVNPGGRVIWSLENSWALSSYRVASGK